MSHISEALSSLGKRVKRGEHIALSGDTGLYQGRRVVPHVHFHLLLSSPIALYYNRATDPFGEYSAWTVNNDPQYPMPD